MVQQKKAYKYNVGLDATLFGGLTLTADAFYEKRQRYLGYIQVVRIRQYWVQQLLMLMLVWLIKGLEFGANYIKSLGKVLFSILGGTFTLTKNKIVEQLEEPRKAYEYLRATGKAVGQIFGYQQWE